MGLLLALLLGGATHAASKDNRVTQRVIGLNVEETENLAARIDRNMDIALRECDDSLERLYNANKKVFETTFPRFAAAASKIMNIDFNERQEQFQKLSKTPEIDTFFKTSPMYTGAVDGAFRALTTFSNFSAPGAGLLVQVVYSSKLKASLAESKTELARIQSMVEVAKREIAKMRSIMNLANTAMNTVETMQVLADGAIGELEEILETYGLDYRSYPEDVKDRTWLTFKMISALNELVTMQILTQSGAVSGKFRKFVGDINVEFLEG